MLANELPKLPKPPKPLPEAYPPMAASYPLQASRLRSSVPGVATVHNKQEIRQHCSSLAGS